MPAPVTPTRADLPHSLQRVALSDGPAHRSQMLETATTRRRKARASMPASRPIIEIVRGTNDAARLLASPSERQAQRAITINGGRSSVPLVQPRHLFQGIVSIPSTPKRARASALQRDDAGQISDADIMERCTIINSIACNVLILYGQVGKALLSGQHKEIIKTLEQTWPTLVNLKDYALLSEMCNLPARPYIDADAVAERVAVSRNPQVAALVSELVINLNRAQFIHSVYQLPIGAKSSSRESTLIVQQLAATGSLIAPRDSFETEFTEALSAFWTSIVPLDENLEVSDDEVALYLDICSQLLIMTCLIQGYEGGEQQDVLALASRIFDPTNLKEHLDSICTRLNIADAKQKIDVVLEKYGEIYSLYIEEIERLEENLALMQREHPFLTMAIDVSDYLIDLAQAQNSSKDSGPFSSTLKKIQREIDEGSIQTPPAAGARKTPSMSSPSPSQSEDLHSQSQRAASQTLAQKRASVGAAAARDEASARVQHMDKSRRSVAWVPQHATAEAGPSNAQLSRAFPRGPVEQAQDEHFDDNDEDDFLEQETRKGKQGSRRKRRLATDERDQDQSTPKASEARADKGKQRETADAEASSSSDSQPTLRRSARISSSMQHLEDTTEGQAPPMQNEQQRRDDGEWEMEEDELVLTNEDASRERKKKRMLKRHSRPVLRMETESSQGSPSPQREESLGNHDRTQARGSQAGTQAPRASRTLRRDDSESNVTTPSGRTPARRQRSASGGETPKRSRYVTGHNLRGRDPWTRAESACLFGTLDELEPKIREEGVPHIYARILEMHGNSGSESNVLARRNNVQLKDKARNEVLRRKRMGEQTPSWAELLFRTLA